MAGATNEMIYELATAMNGQLSCIDATLGSIDGHLDAMDATLRDIRAKTDGMPGDIAGIDPILGRLDASIYRIEKRLDIIEEPAE